MARELQNMVVVITGASAGIGRELAVQLSDAGALLALGARRLDRLESLNQQLGSKHLVQQCDVGRLQDCQSLIDQTVARFGRVDTVVANAGYGLAKSIVDTSADDFSKIFATNVFGTTDLIRAAVPIMLKQAPVNGYRGQVMIVSSAVARRGLPWFGAYSATKAAQLSIAEALRVELKPELIGVTSIHPVGTATDFFDVAGTLANATVPKEITGAPFRQTAATVARRMVRAIRRPRTEVWPMPPARWGLSLATLFPGLVDRGLKGFRKPAAR